LLITAPWIKFFWEEINLDPETPADGIKQSARIAPFTGILLKSPNAIPY